MFMFSVSLVRISKTIFRDASDGKHPFMLFVLKGKLLMFSLMLVQLVGDLSLPPKGVDIIDNHNKDPFLGFCAPGTKH